MKKEIIIGLGLGLIIAAFTVFQPKRRWLLPSGVWVEENKLPSLGYVQKEGKWYLVSYLNQATGTKKSGDDWQKLIDDGVELYKQGKTIWDWVQQNYGKNAVLTAEVDRGIPV